MRKMILGAATAGALVISPLASAEESGRTLSQAEIEALVSGGDVKTTPETTAPARVVVSEAAATSTRTMEKVTVTAPAQPVQGVVTVQPNERVTGPGLVRSGIVKSDPRGGVTAIRSYADRAAGDAVAKDINRIVTRSEAAGTPVGATTAIRATTNLPAVRTRTAPKMASFDVNNAAKYAALFSKADDYQAFLRQVDTLRSTPFSSAADIDKSIRNLASNGGKDQITQGMIVSLALTIVNDPSIEQEISDIISTYGASDFINGAVGDQTYVPNMSQFSTRPYDRLGSKIAGAVSADINSIRSAGSAVKERAYDLQTQGWAKAKIGGAKDSLTGFLLHPSPSFEEDAPSVLLTKINNRYGKAPAASSTSQYKDAIEKTITVAALMRAGANQQEILRSLQDSDFSGDLVMANLNLQQCIAAARQVYESPFCEGQHSLLEVSEAMTKSARQ